MGATGAFVIPSIFTAIDKYSAPVRAMASNTAAFASKVETGLARAERGFRKFTPNISEFGKQFLSFAGTAAIVAGIMAGISFSFGAVKDYETSVQSFRTIVSDLNDADFSKYEDKIAQVAIATNKSTIDTAKAFEMIAGLNAKFAETPEKIAAVTQAAITLSKASRDDLGKSASNLVGILNQFNLAATESDRVINVLAAGQAVGASTITQTADAFTVFGSVAAASNLTLEQSTALIEVLASKQIMGAEAGTALRGSMLALQKAGVGYKSGMFNMRDAIVEVQEKLGKLKTAKEKDALMTDVFGVINRTAGTILVNNIGLYDEFTKSVTGTSEAQKAAAINSNTLAVTIEELKAAWVNLLTTNSKTSASLEILKTLLRFIARNLSTIVLVVGTVIALFVGFKIALIATRIALTAYYIVAGITAVATGSLSVAMARNAVVAGTVKTIMWLVTAAQWAWNAALYANPIGLIILAILAMIAVIVIVIKKYNEWGAAITFLLGPVGFLINLIQAFRRNWEMIEQAFSTGGVLAGFKAIGATILDAILMPLQQVLGIIANLTGFEWAADAVKNIEKFRADIGVNTTTDESGAALNKPLLNPEMAKQESFRESINTERQSLDINIQDNSGGSAIITPGTNMAKNIKLSSTVGFKK